MAKTDAFTLIKEDHDRFRKLFKQYEDKFEDKPDADPKAKLKLANQIFRELFIHEQIEEEIFYPAIREHATQEGVESVLEGYQEHHVADLLIDELKALDVHDETYDPKFKVLWENVEHHLDEEEGELFPEAKKALANRAVEVGERMAARKEELMKEGAPAR